MSDENAITLERRSLESMVLNNLQTIAILSGRISALEKQVAELVRRQHQDDEYNMEQSELEP